MSTLTASASVARRVNHSLDLQASLPAPPGSNATATTSTKAKPAIVNSATVDATILLEATKSLLAQLGDTDLDSEAINWNEFPALMQMWDILWLAQERILQEAARILRYLNALEENESNLNEWKAGLEEIRQSKLDERAHFFHNGLFWRRHVSIWKAWNSVPAIASAYNYTLRLLICCPLFLPLSQFLSSGYLALLSYQFRSNPISS